MGCGGSPMDMFMPRTTWFVDSVMFPRRTSTGYGAQLTVGRNLGYFDYKKSRKMGDRKMKQSTVDKQDKLAKTAVIE